MAETAQKRPPNEEETKYNHLLSIQTFMGHLQKGDLATTVMVPYGFVLYGMTRIGKTATSHLLSGNPLRGIRMGGQDMVNVSTYKNLNAKIGNSMNSETVIPNKFELKNFKVDGIHPACVIDTPGYGDTYGVLRILANGYFHYRLYSKIQNLKFIICFDENHLSGDGKNILETIIQWSKSFNNYTDLKEKIWDSCCFLFTKVPENETLDAIKERLSTLVQTVKAQLSPQDLDNLRRFIQYMVDQDKIFIIKKYRQGQTSNEGQLLSEIDKKIKTWWHRDLNPSKTDEVDMSDIAFSLGKDVLVETTRAEISQEQLSELISIYSERISEFVSKSEKSNEKYSIADVLDELTNDALGKPDSHNFLTLMDEYVKKYHPNVRKNARDDGFKEQREKYEKAMFETQISMSKSKVSKDSSEHQKKTKTQNFPIKKLTALKKIEELMQKINTKELIGRDIKWLEQCEVILIEIIKTLGSVAYKKKDRENIIYRYGYLIHRLVEEAKVFVLLLEKFSTPKIQQDLKRACDGKVIELFRPLKDLMGVGFAYKDKDALSYIDVHEIYVSNFDLNNPDNSNLEMTYEFADLFTQASIEDYHTKLKVSTIVEKYSTNKLSDKTRTIKNNEYYKMIQKLVKATNDCHDLYLLFEDKKDKDQTTLIVKKLSKNLGQVLGRMKKYELARKVYHSIRQVDSVCLVYDQMIKDFDNTGKSSLEVRINYSKYLRSHLREADAIKLLQQTYDMIDVVEQLDIISQQMNEAIPAMKSKDRQTTDYEKNMFDKSYIEKIDDQTLNELEKLYKGQKIQEEETIQFFSNCN